MTQRVKLPGEHAMGLDMHDGTKYDVRRGQTTVEVTDEHAELLKRYTGLQVGQEWRATPETPGVVCSTCGFSQYRALAGPLCKKCGGNWEE